MTELNELDLMKIYEWIDAIPLSREKKNITRDFSDGVMLAEIIKYYHPKYVELHNYPSTLSSKQKLSNWNTLCLKVFKKIKMTISQDEINEIVNCKPKAIEKVLFRLYNLLVKNEHNNNKEGLNIELTNDADKLKKDIEFLDSEITTLTDKKNNLENSIKETEQECAILQRKIEEINTKFEYRQGM